MVTKTAKGWGLLALGWLLLAVSAGAAAAQEGDSRLLERGCKQELEEGSPRLALILCERRAHMADADAGAFRDLGQAYAANGLLPEAKAAYRRAIQLGGDPEDLRAMIAVADEQAPPRPEPGPEWAPTAVAPAAASQPPQQPQEEAPAPDPLVITAEAPEIAAVDQSGEQPPDEEGPLPEEGRIAVQALPDQAEPSYLPEPAPETAPEPAPKAEALPEPQEAQAQVAPAVAPSGPYRIQLASLTSSEAATQTAEALKLRYAALLSGLSAARQTVDLPGRGRFHRVQFEGLASRADAQALCRRFKALDQDCFVPSLPG